MRCRVDAASTVALVGAGASVEAGLPDARMLGSFVLELHGTRRVHGGREGQPTPPERLELSASGKFGRRFRLLVDGLSSSGLFAGNPADLYALPLVVRASKRATSSFHCFALSTGAPELLISPALACG